VISLVGTPGSGKTTQAKLLSEYLHCPWFSQGELIRQRATGQARQDMLQGKIIDDSVTLQILSDVLATLDTSKDECIIEGNPRTLTQAKWWEEKINSGQFKLRGFVHLTASEKVVEERLKKRGRLDDFDFGVIQKRLAEYRKNTKKGLEYLESKGWQVHEISANGTIEEVAKDIRKALGL
jgi:adenylate kinase